MNVAYVENDSAEDNMRAIKINGIITTDMMDINGDMKFMVHQSSSQYGGIRSEINHVYILAIVKMS